jgi:thiol-disulfide isomerase/thioredoxin
MNRAPQLVGVVAACAALGCAAAPSLQLANRAQYDALIGERRGEVVLVDFWATWCAPCLEQLPHTIDLAERRVGDGLAVITVSMDSGIARPQAENILAGLGPKAALATHLISADGGGPGAMEAFEIASGALPHYKLYDRTGKLRRTFDLDPSADEQFTVEDIDAAAAELLAEEAE